MLPAMSATATPSPFHRAAKLIGSYAAVGLIFDPPVSPQGVSKWAEAGVPGERVLKMAEATDYEVTPHELRPDLYPNPDDGVPMSRRVPPEQGRAAA